MVTWWSIGMGLIVEYLFVRQLTSFDIKKSIVVDLTMKVNDLLRMIREILKKDVKIEYVKPKSNDPMEHYTITPYTFLPKVGKKYVKHYYTDMGQGLLLCMQEIFDKTHNG